MFDRLGRLVIRFRYVLVLGWLVAAALFGALAPSLSEAGFADETSFLPRDAESLAARHVIAQAFPSDTSATVALIVFSRAGGLTDTDRAAIEGLRPYFEGSGHADTILRYVTAEELAVAGVDVPQPGWSGGTRPAGPVHTVVPAAHQRIDRRDSRPSRRGRRPPGRASRPRYPARPASAATTSPAIRDGTEPDHVRDDRPRRPGAAPHLPRPAGGPRAAASRSGRRSWSPAAYSASWPRAAGSCRRSSTRSSSCSSSASARTTRSS